VHYAAFLTHFIFVPKRIVGFICRIDLSCAPLRHRAGGAVRVGVAACFDARRGTMRLILPVVRCPNRSVKVKRGRLETRNG